MGAKVRWFMFTGLALLLAATVHAEDRSRDGALFEENGKAMFEGGRWEEAAAQFGAAYTRNNDPAMLFNMALCHRKAGNPKRALGLYQRYLIEAPPGPNRAVAQARINDLQQELAAEAPGSLPASVPAAGPAKDAATYEQEGKQAFEAGRWAEAAVAFEGAYRIGKDPALLYNMALCQRKAGNAKRALDLYQQYLLAAPDTPKRATVEARIQELQLDLAGCDPPCGPGRMCSGAGACVAGQGADGQVSAGGEGAFRGPTAYAFGVGLGYASGGSVTWDGTSYSPDGGFLLDLFVDKILAPAFSLGAYATISSMSISGWSNVDVSYQSLGAVLKARFELSPSVRLRPGLTLGFNRMSSSAFTETSTGMNLGMHVDLAIATSNTFALVPRLGFFSQPTGGYANNDITFGPHFYLAFAVEFGR